MLIQKRPEQFPVHALERVVRILQGRIAQINKANVNKGRSIEQSIMSQAQ